MSFKAYGPLRGMLQWQEGRGGESQIVFFPISLHKKLLLCAADPRECLPQLQKASVSCPKMNSSFQSGKV